MGSLDPNPYDSYAELLMKLGRYEESIQQYKKALDVNPEFFASHMGISNNLMFLRRYEKMIIEQVVYWHGDPNYNELKKIVNKMKFIADVYNLIIYIDDHKKALVDITSLLMIYACGKYGMDKIYE